MLKKPHFLDVEAEYNRRLRYNAIATLRTKPVKSVEWFALFGGPDGGGIRNLAKFLNQESCYIFLYKPASAIVHAEDITRLFGKDSKEGYTFNRLRNPRKIDDLIYLLSLGISFMTGATNLLLRRYRPGEEQATKAWYATEIKPLRDKLHNQK